MSDLIQKPILREFIDLVIEANWKLNAPDMSGQKYQDSKYALKKAHSLIPNVLKENLGSAGKTS